MWNDTALEIENTLRTNPDIAAIEETLLAEKSEAMSVEYEQLFPEFLTTTRPRELVGIACNLMRGLVNSEKDEDAERRFEVCAAMLRAYLDSSERKAG